MLQRVAANRSLVVRFVFVFEVMFWGAQFNILQFAQFFTVRHVLAESSYELIHVSRVPHREAVRKPAFDSRCLYHPS
jgi:hypothetical protein